MDECVHMGRMVGVFFVGWGLFSGVLALKQTCRTRSFVTCIYGEGIPSRGNCKGKGQEDRASLTLLQDKHWAQCGEAKGKVLGEKIREGTEWLDHMGVKLQQQPGLFRVYALSSNLSVCCTRFQVVVSPPSDINFYQFVKILSATLVDTYHCDNLNFI